MRKVCSFCIIIFCILFASCNQVKDEDTLLWKISGNGLEKPSYLFATWEWNAKDSASIIEFCNNYPHFAEYLASTSFFITENSPLEPVVNIANNNKFLKAIHMPKDTTYNDLFDIETLHWLNKLSTQYLQIPIDSVSVKPTYLMYIINTIKNSEENKEDSIRTKTISSYLFNFAIEKGIQANSLEQNWDIWEMTLPFFYFPLKEQASWVKYLNTAEGKDTFNRGDSIRNKVTDAYMKYEIQKIDLLFKELDNNNIMSKYTSDNVVKKRNNKWMRKITPAMKNNSTFFALNIRYLLGENGLIHLLRNDGYKVEPIKTIKE